MTMPVGSKSSRAAMMPRLRGATWYPQWPDNVQPRTPVTRLAPTPPTAAAPPVTISAWGVRARAAYSAFGWRWVRVPIGAKPFGVGPASEDKQARRVDPLFH